MAENWIIPCNISFFDLIHHFETNKTVVWRNAFTIRQGDTAYIYIGRPYSEIMLKCKVVSDHVDDVQLSENSYAIPVKKTHSFFSKKDKNMVLEHLCTYPAGTFPLDMLRQNGLGQVQIQARTDRKLQAFLSKTELEIENGGGDNA